MSRDGRLRAALGLLVVLAVLSLVAGARYNASIQAEHRRASAEQRDLWLNKGEMNPHSAAHYGSFAFKPKSILASADPGLDPYLGVSVFMEAHRQNLAKYRPIEDATPARRLGSLTAAGVLQILAPLLIVALTFGAYSGEREEGTLKQILSQGVSVRDLALGKALGVALPVLLALVPVALAGATALLLFGSDGLAPDLPRVLLLSGAYLGYFVVWVGLGLIVSARAASSRAALVVLVSLWFANGFVAPRVGSLVSRWAHPAPDAAAFAKAIEADARAQPSWETLVKTSAEKLMAQYSVDSVDKLPVNPEALALVAGEDADTKVYAKHFGALNDAHGAQSRVYQMAGVAAPLLALQSLSMSLAGTDFAHHRDFADSAEAYRTQMVAALNESIVKHDRPQEIWDYKEGRLLWEKVPPFHYERPGTGFAVKHATIAVGALALWFVVVAAGLGPALRGLRVE